MSGCLKQTPTPGTYSQELIKCSSIRHPALQRYYAENPESLVQNTKSFSFLLRERSGGLNFIPEVETSIPESQTFIQSCVATPIHQKVPEAQSSNIVAPPPLPPVAPVPPPPSLATSTLLESDGQAPTDKYTVALHSMENKLQKRIKNRGVVAVDNEKHRPTDTTVKVIMSRIINLLYILDHSYCLDMRLFDRENFDNSLTICQNFTHQISNYILECLTDSSLFYVLL